MKKLLASAIFAFGAYALAGSAQAADCGSVSIAEMNWASAGVAAQVDKIILQNGYGCNVTLVTGDTQPTFTSMDEKGQPDVAPELWVNAVRTALDKAVSEGRLIVAAPLLSDGGVEGWWIPKFLADAHPDIKTVQDALKHPELFPDPEDAKKGAIVNGPQGWGGTVVTSQLYKAFGAEKAGFTLVDTGSAAGLDGSIAKAYERKQGWVGYYWAPTALLGKYQMVKLDAGVPADAAEWKRCNTVADCPDPKPNAWPVDRVVTLVAKTFADKAGPDVMDYLKKRAWSNDTVNKLMAWMTDNQATGEDGAKHFLKENKDLWSKWVSPEAAKKIEASL